MYKHTYWFYNSPGLQSRSSSECQSVLVLWCSLWANVKLLPCPYTSLMFLKKNNNFSPCRQRNTGSLRLVYEWTNPESGIPIRVLSLSPPVKWRVFFSLSVSGSALTSSKTTLWKPVMSSRRWRPRACSRRHALKADPLLKTCLSHF